MIAVRRRSRPSSPSTLPADALGTRDERARRALAAARAHLAAGEWTHARSIAGELLAETAQGPVRAEALLVLAEFHHDDLAVPVLEEAVREASSQPALQARILLRLALAERFRKGFPSALDGTRAAVALVDGLDDHALSFEALAQLCWLGRMTGDAEAPEYAARARDIAAATGDARLLRDANAFLDGTLSRLRRASTPDARSSSASIESGTSATSCSVRTLSGSSRGSSSGPGAGRSQRSTPRAPATSGSSTASRGTRTTSRAPGSQYIVASSTSRGLSPREA